MFKYIKDSETIMRPASKPRRVIPQKIRKKERSKILIDKRPHKSVQINNHLIDTEIEKHSKCLLSRRDVFKWTKAEIHSLIDQHHEILKFRPKVVKQLHNLAGHILRRWKRNNFLCEITNLPLLGGLGFGPRAVGIDFKSHKTGAKKHNIRLITAPIAVSRHLGIREPDIKMSTDKFTDEILFAISKYLHWAIKDDQRLKYLPIEIKITESSSDHPRFIDCQAAIPFFNNWSLDDPWTYIQYYHLERKIQTQRVFEATYQGDSITIKYCDEPRYYDNGQKINYTFVEKMLPLSDPNINLMKEVTNGIYLGYHNIVKNFVTDEYQK